MPVLFESATSGNFTKITTSGATSGSITATHAVSPLATNVLGIVAFYVKADVATSGATLSVTWGGTAMTQSALVSFASDNAVALFTLAGPPSGRQSVVGSVSGLTANAGGFVLMMDTASYSGVGFIGTPVTVTGDTAGAATANTVTADSSLAAFRVITVHATSQGSFSAYNLTARSVTDDIVNFTVEEFFLGIFPIGTGVESVPAGELLLGDAPGAATVTGTATQTSTADWAAIALPLSPCPVVAAGALNVSMSVGQTTVSVQRNAPPSPLRTWIIGVSQ